MNADAATDLAQQAVMQVILLGAPVLIVGLVSGLLVSLLQAVTQMHDHTLSFVPKIIAMLIALAIFGPWMMTRIAEFGTEMFSAAQ